MRATGRTTRMLADAVAQARSGRAVYVVAASEQSRRNLENAAGEEARALGVKFETAATVGQIDCTRMRVHGAHPNCMLLVDHYAIETIFSEVLEMLHRYDYAPPR